MKIREIKLQRELFGKPIAAHALVTENGISVLIAGGDKSHIGAVTVVNPMGQLTTTEFPGHREAVVSQRWAEHLASQSRLPMIVSAGVHYDGLSREGIEAVLTFLEDMLIEMEAELDA